MDCIDSSRCRDLLIRAASGDLAAEEILISTYGKLVKACARPYFLAGGDSEDLLQEGMLGLLSAIRGFDPDKGVDFSSFAEFCVRRRLYSAIRSASSFKHSPLNNYISLESHQFDGTGASAYSLRDPEDFVIARESAREVGRLLQGALSRFESGVLELYLEGLSYDDMALRFNRTNKSVDNAVQRIRRKLAQILLFGDNQ